MLYFKPKSVIFVSKIRFSRFFFDFFVVYDVKINFKNVISHLEPINDF